MGLSENFWEQINLYRKLGFDPLRWVPTCSNEVDIHIMRAALAELKHSRIKVSPSWFDSFYHIDGRIPELTRRVYSLANPVMDKEVELKRALQYSGFILVLVNMRPCYLKHLRTFLKSSTRRCQ